MSSSEGRAASGSALSVQLVEDMVIDMGVMTPRNKRANPSEDSSSSGSGRLWIADGSDSSSDDDSVTVNAKLGQRKKKKKKIVAERKSDYFLKDKTPEGPGKGKVSDTTVKRPMPVTSATLDMPSTVGSVSNQCRPNAQSAVNKPPTETTVDTGSVNAAVKAPAKRVPVGRSIENRLFIEFIGIALSSVDAFRVRTELNTKFGPLTADVPTPSSSYVRVHLGGPSRVANRATLLGTTDLCGYKIKVSEPREVVRHRGRYIQKVIKGVPPALSDSEILASVKDQERLPVLKVSRIHKVENKVKVPTLAVQINFTSGAVVPERLYIGFLTFKLYDYVPPPTRCFKCLSLGHISKFCRQKKPRCGICAGDHQHTECTKRDKPKCAACGGPHPAMARSCPKYALAKAATSISVREGVLYSDALRMARKDQHQASTTPKAPSQETPTTTAAVSTGGPARPESLCTLPSGESSRQRPKVVRPPTAAAPVVPYGQQEEATQVVEGKTQRAALDALTRACTLFVKAMEATECGSAIPPTKIIQILVSTISVAFNIPQDTVYAASAQSSDASSATSATTPDDRNH